MLTRLKEMFRAGPGRKPRVNLDRRFTIVSEAAHGTMSRVYRALDGSTGRTVCLKVQIPDKNQAAAARTGEPRPDEGELASRVIHPNVVRTIEWGVSTRNEHFIVMEYIDGVSLQFVRETRSAPRLGDKLELLAQAAEGLAAVHEAGLIHHDINPRNYLVDRAQQVKLIDFGLTVPNTPAFRRPGNRTGTLNYMAPELVRREAIDERIDVFAFGALAFEFLTGRLPYESTNSMTAILARINHEPLDPGKVDPTLPAAVQEFLRRLLARRKDDRWPSMSTAADALRSIGTRGR